MAPYSEALIAVMRWFRHRNTESAYEFTAWVDGGAPQSAPCPAFTVSSVCQCSGARECTVTSQFEGRHGAGAAGLPLKVSRN
jgi:hypothetical protein